MLDGSLMERMKSLKREVIWSDDSSKVNSDAEKRGA